MKPERWRQINELYNQAVELDQSQRTAFLREACAGDDDLRRELEKLLTQEPGSFLEEPAVQGMALEFAARPAASMIGTRIAHYQITSHLGTGGMGEVYQAADSRLGRSVAIKLLPEAFTHDRDRAARFDREARLLASLNHPNIAAIHGIEESGGRKFLVMELVPGETLAQRIRRGAIPLDESLDIAGQIAEAMEAAHEKAVIHRDLKPANVKITPGGKVKVLDFGLAKAFDGEAAEVDPSLSPTISNAATVQGMILGTAAYMSPEQAVGKRVDKRADIWAFGVVLWEMLTGEQLFKGETVSYIMASVLKEEPDLTRVPFRVRRCGIL